MIAMNYSTLRNNMKTAFDECCDAAETLFVTRKDNKNVVVMSEEAYNNLMDRLLEGVAQAKAGCLTKRDLIEDE